MAVEVYCDNCKGNLLSNGDTCFCSRCYNKLTAEIEKLKAEIEQLKGEKR